ncbi:MAG: hypothetical protein ETSY1_37245 [Candidatus Entotheonella factor]|uniref:Big-1 domain-containing protein n=2 Tax=Candidatus Entotheonella TaxID=93171 RepID=W4L749_ENTF1|nr:MAG: hypothetical protein ETSY1_37245 [Candidatus Entotheonella factor]
MPATVRMTMVFLLALVPIAFLQGCGSNSGGDSAVSNSGANLNLTLRSTTGANTLTADGTSSLDIEVSAASQDDGRPIANLEILFSTTAGVLSAGVPTNTNTRQVTGNSITVRTNANGIAFVTLTATNIVGTAIVTAETPGGFRQSFTVSFVSGVPAAMTLAASPNTISSGASAAIEARVVDDMGRAVAGVTVTFSVSPNLSGSILGTTTVNTDVEGIASTTLTGGAAAGTDTVRAQISGNITATADVAVIAQTTGGDTPPTVSIDSVSLLVSSPQLDSDDSQQKVTLTALVRDDNNNFVPDIPVSFSADSGGIQVLQGVTDAAGAATAELGTAGDPANRIIEVTATAGTFSDTNVVEVSGTTLTLNGPNTLAQGGTTTLSILLQNSGGNGIPNECVAIVSTSNNTLASPTEAAAGECTNIGSASDFKLKTDFNGQATLDVTVNQGGQHTITARALARTTTLGSRVTEGILTLTVSSANFIFLSPPPAQEINLGNLETVTIQWQDDQGVAQAGKTVNFFITRGEVSGGNLTVSSSVTDNQGQATVSISANTAGPGVVTAEADEAGGPSAQLAVEFVATNPTSLILQANPTSLGVNLPGDTDQQSIITAVVRDVNHNLVKNQQVSFTLTDNTGGSIFPASAVTDSFGRASTVYTAGSVSSAQDGVVIESRVVGTDNCDAEDAVLAGACDKVALTVAQQAVFVTLGTSHLIEEAANTNGTMYDKPYSVLVTDINSNPIEGATVELNLYPTRYQKGFYTLAFDEDLNCVGWAKFPTVDFDINVPFEDDRDQACDNEDVNRNGIWDGAEDLNGNGVLDANEDLNGNGILDRGEDINANSALDPGNIAEVPTTVTTDATGVGLFHIRYAREYTWVEVELEARVTVFGSEDIDTARFFLPGLASDFNDCEISPPGQISPYGTDTTCSCNETVDPSCPTIDRLIPVSISPTFTIASVGDTISFSVAGGTQTLYDLSVTTGGIIIPSTTIPFDPTGTNFQVLIDSAPLSGEIQVTVRDRNSSLAADALVQIP